MFVGTHRTHYRREARETEISATNCTIVPVEGGPQNIVWTHPDEVDAALLRSLSKDS
jgi:non-heme chloroperoxidase